MDTIMLMNFEVAAKCTSDFKTMLDKDESAVRYLVMKADEVITEDCPPAPELHTLRPGMDDDDEKDDEDEGDREYNDVVLDNDGVKSFFGDGEGRENESANMSSTKRRPGKVGK